MANKYCNLQGSRKISESYNNINEGFDDVEKDINMVNSRINTIITTPIDGEAAAQEIVDARAGFPTIGARISNVEDNLNSHLAETMHYEGRRFKINNPIKGGSLVLKGQLHCHTNNSDGVDTPTAVVTAYKNAGYDFTVISDHNKITDDPNVEGIIFIPAIEESYQQHVVVYDPNAKSDFVDPQTIINDSRTKGKLTSVAHPARPSRPIGQFGILGYYNNNFVEIFNALNPLAEDYWDIILSSGKKVFATAVDDLHDLSDPSNFNKGYVVVYAEENTKEAILQSLRDGNFYASTGNDITITMDGNVITASSSELSNITFVGEHGRELHTEDNVLSSSYTIRGDEMYVRVKSEKVSDSTFAWSQPIFVDCLGDDGRILIDLLKGIGKIAPNKNLLINPHFFNPVNQRGLTVYPTGSTRVTADRWKASGTMLVSVNDGYLTLTGSSTSSWLRQYIEGVIPAGVYTVSVIARAKSGCNIHIGFGGAIDGEPTSYIAAIAGNGADDVWTLTQISAEVPEGINADSFFVALRVTVGGGSVDVFAVKFEKGAISTLANEPPANYGEQLLLCQRYYEKQSVRTINGGIWVPWKVTKRITPTTLSASVGTLQNATVDGAILSHNAEANSTIIADAEI